MKKVILLLLFFITLFGLNAQNTAHNDWDLLDKPVRRAHWSWVQYATASEQKQNAYLEFCRNKSISDLYLWVAEFGWDSTFVIGNEPELAAFIRKANGLGIKVWGVYYLYDNDEDTLEFRGDNSNNTIAAAEQVADVFADFNRNYPDAGFYGIQNDNEPKLTSNLVPFLLFCETVTNSINNLNQTLISEGASPLIHSAAIRPSWVNSEQVDYNGSYDYVAYHYLRTNDHAALMNYNSNINNFINRGETMLGWADSIPGDQIVSIGIETDDILGQWPNSHYETYADEIFEENDTTRFNQFESDMDQAEEVFMNYDSYERIAIHADGYVRHWFDGESDFDIIGNAPEGTQYVDLFQDASPNAYNWPINDAPQILNSSFSYGTEPWEYTNGASWIKNIKNTYSGRGAAKLLDDNDGIIGNNARVSQIITGLRPNTTYTMSAYLKVLDGGQIRLYVDDYGGSKKHVKVFSDTYQRASLTFTTGSVNSSVLVYANIRSGRGFADDFEIIESGTNTSDEKNNIQSSISIENEEELNQIRLFSTNANEQLNYYIPSSNKLLDLKVYDIRGIEMISLSKDFKNEGYIDVSGLPSAGFYILNLSTKKGDKTLKFLKQ